MKRLTPWDVAYATDMTIACWLSYTAAAWVLASFVNRSDDLLGGMWAVVATIFVFRETRVSSLSAGLNRLVATVVSFALCLGYLLFLPSTPLAIGMLIGVGTVIMMLLDRRDDISLTGITTTVVLVVAAISPENAWQQPLLRLVDTVVGVAVGISCKWVGSYVFYRAIGEPVR
jgi:uncharacterized membrane protein YgaE (UPF0421/DUF939 family)